MAKAMPTTAEAADVTGEIGDDALAPDAADLDYVPRTELGRLAIAACREYIASGGRLLSPEEIEREVAERRDGTHLLDDR